MKRSLIALSLVILASACGGGPSASKGFSPRSDDQLVLKIENKGGFLPASASLTSLPSIVLYADGMVITPGPQIEIYPPPAMPNLRVRKVSDEKVSEVVAAARDAGLTDGDKSYANNTVMDASTAVFTVDNSERVSVVEVYALDAGEESGPRGKISAFQRKVFTIIGEGDDEEYVADRFQIVTTSDLEQSPSDDIAASHKSWPLDAVPGSIGESYNGRGMQAARCAIVEGDQLKKLVAALREANTLTQWDFEGASYQIYPRPLMPGEEGCV